MSFVITHARSPSPPPPPAVVNAFQVTIDVYYAADKSELKRRFALAARIDPEASAVEYGTMKIEISLKVSRARVCVCARARGWEPERRHRRRPSASSQCLLLCRNGERRNGRRWNERCRPWLRPAPRTTKRPRSSPDRTCCPTSRHTTPRRTRRRRTGTRSIASRKRFSPLVCRRHRRRRHRRCRHPLLFAWPRADGGRGEERRTRRTAAIVPNNLRGRRRGRPSVRRFSAALRPFAHMCFRAECAHSHTRTRDGP